jgi:hypothetical protein
MRRPAAIVLFLTALAAVRCRQAKTAELRPPKATPDAPAAAVDVAADPYGLKPSEKAAVESFLKANPRLRLAMDADARAPDTSLIRLYGIYHPYFVRGDVNDDGLLDLVVGFVRRDSPAAGAWFSVVVFAGREGGRFDAGVFLERDISLADGDLSVDRDSIVITPDTNDDPTRRYRWDAMRRQFKFVSEDDEAPETPAVSRTRFGFRVSRLERAGVRS